MSLVVSWFWSHAIIIKTVDKSVRVNMSKNFSVIRKTCGAFHIGWKKPTGGRFKTEPFHAPNLVLEN